MKTSEATDRIIDTALADAIDRILATDPDHGVLEIRRTREHEGGDPGYAMIWRTTAKASTVTTQGLRVPQSDGALRYLAANMAEFAERQRRPETP